VNKERGDEMNSRFFRAIILALKRVAIKVMLELLGYKEQESETSFKVEHSSDRKIVIITYHRKDIRR